MNPYWFESWYKVKGLPRWLSGKEYACQCRCCRRQGFLSLAQEDTMEKEMATQYSG